MPQMLSIRLPMALQYQLQEYCTAHGVTKTQAVQLALQAFLATPANKKSLLPRRDPLFKWVGRLNRGMSTEELMCMTRGEDWNRA